VHWDGTAWSATQGIDPTISLHGVWGSAANDVWAVGRRDVAGVIDPMSVILHWNGTAWTPTAHPESLALWDVTGSAANNVWTIPNADLPPLRWDGTAWAAVPCQSSCLAPFGVWTSGPNDTWTVGYTEWVQHWDGSAWSRPPGNATGDYLAVWGSASNDVWISGYMGELVHWNGTTMTCGGEKLVTWGQSALA
jgi:hypothetical protein